MVFFCTKSVLQDVHILRFTNKISRFCWKLCQILEAFAKTFPPFVPFSDQPFLLLGKNLPGVTVVSLPAASWQRSLVPWEAFKIRVSAPSAVLVGAIAPWPRWQWTKHWLFRAYRGGIYYPVTWGSQDLYETIRIQWKVRDPGFFSCHRPRPWYHTRGLLTRGSPEIMRIHEDANPPQCHWSSESLIDHWSDQWSGVGILTADRRIRHTHRKNLPPPFRMFLPYVFYLFGYLKMSLDFAVGEVSKFCKEWSCGVVITFFDANCALFDPLAFYAIVRGRYTERISTRSCMFHGPYMLVPTRQWEDGTHSPLVGVVPFLPEFHLTSPC